MSAGQTSTILVVEDDPRLARLAQLNLEAEGYKVVLHSDGGSAIDYLHQDKPDLVLLDLMLPTVSGWEVLRSVRQDGRMEGVPVIVISAMAHKVDRQRALSEGAQEFFAKPFGIHDLMDCIAGYLGEADHA